MVSTSNDTASNKAIIWTYPTYAIIRGPLDDVAHLLMHEVRTFIAAADGRLQDELLPCAFFGVDVLDRLIVPLGLVNPLREAWEAAGVSVEIRTGEELPVHLTRAIVNTIGADGMSDPFACSLADNVCGQIEVRGIRDMIHRVAAIRRALPTEPILLLAATHKQCHEILNRLMKELREPVRLGIAEGLPETWVCVSLMRVPRTPAFYRIVLVMAHDLGLKGCETLGHILTRPQRRYAFVFRNRPLDALQRHTVLALFGPPIWRLGNASRDQVTVLTCDPTFPGPPRGLSGLAFKRTAIWHNDARNRVIASVATAVLKADKNALLAKGMIVDDAAFILPPEGCLRTMLLVESPEHGRELQKHLPGWPLLERVPGRAASDRAVSASNTKAAIATICWTRRFGFPCQVLLRADAGVAGSVASFGAITGTNMANPDNNADADDTSNANDRAKAAIPAHLTMIDFYEAGDRQDGLRRRLREYRNQGWLTPYVSKTQAERPSKLPPPFRRPRGRGERAPATTSFPDERRPRPHSPPDPSSPSPSCKMGSTSPNRNPRDTRGSRKGLDLI